MTFCGFTNLGNHKPATLHTNFAQHTTQVAIYMLLQSQCIQQAATLHDAYNKEQHAANQRHRAWINRITLLVCISICRPQKPPAHRLRNVLLRTEPWREWLLCLKRIRDTIKSYIISLRTKPYKIICRQHVKYQHHCVCAVYKHTQTHKYVF